MQEILGVSLESLLPAFPLVGFVGLFLSLDKLAGDEKGIAQEYQSLLKQALTERSRAMDRFLHSWRGLGDPTAQEGPPGFIHEFWQRLSEIDEKERDVRVLYNWYNRCRLSVLGVIIVGLLASLFAIFLPTARPLLFWAAITALVATVILAVLARFLGGKVDAFGSHAMFRRT